MPPHILSLPAEILSEILSFLPASSLLRFSATSRHSHAMATANLHTLSLGIAPWPSSYRNPLLLLLLHHHPTESPSLSSSYESWVRIPNMTQYDYPTLFNFQSALVTSILRRHLPLLQHIDLCIWSLSVPTAHALRDLPALKTLALRFESGGRPHARAAALRCHLAAEGAEQQKAWEVLAQSPPVWSRRLRSLKLVNAEVRIHQLDMLLRESSMCRELELERCRGVGSEFWAFLRTWRGCEALRGLGVAECGVCVGKEAVEAIGGLTGLKRLNLYDCQEEMEAGALQRWNEEVWRIADFVPPRSKTHGRDMVIEVDPAYIS